MRTAASAELGAALRRSLEPQTLTARLHVAPDPAVLVKALAAQADAAALVEVLAREFPQRTPEAITEFLRMHARGVMARDRWFRAIVERAEALRGAAPADIVEDVAVEKWRPWRRPPEKAAAEAVERAVRAEVRRAGLEARALAAARGRPGAWTRLWAAHAEAVGARLAPALRRAADGGVEAGVAAARRAGQAPTEQAVAAAFRRAGAWAEARALAAGREIAATSRARWEADPSPAALEPARRGAAAGAAESAAAALEGAHLVWAAAGAATKRWRRSGRPDSCPVCRELDGKTVPLSGEFRTAGWRGKRPPAHPFCGCGLEFSPPKAR